MLLDLMITEIDLNEYKEDFKRRNVSDETWLTNAKNIR